MKPASPIKTVRPSSSQEVVQKLQKDRADFERRLLKLRSLISAQPELLADVLQHWMTPHAH